MVCLRFCQHSDVTFLKEFQQCLNSRYLASTCLSLYTLGSTAVWLSPLAEWLALTSLLRHCQRQYAQLEKYMYIFLKCAKALPTWLG